MICHVVSGVGFLGAGVIMKEGGDVRGLNAAATLWASAAVGACAGSDYVAEAVLVTVMVIAGNTLLRPLVNAINRAPISAEQAEAIHEIDVLVDADRIPDVRESIYSVLNKARYPVADIEMEPVSGGITEIVATLVSESVDAEELNNAISDLRQAGGVSRARWEVCTSE